MTVKELVEKLKSVPGYYEVQVKVECEDPIYSNNGNLYEYSKADMDIHEGSGTVAFKDVRGW